MQMEGENDVTRHIRSVTVKAASFEQVLIWVGTQSKKAMVSRFAKKLGPGEIFYLTVQHYTASEWHFIRAGVQNIKWDNWPKITLNIHVGALMGRI